MFSSLNTFQNYVKETLFDSLKTFNVEWPCTWSSVRLCACHTQTNFILILRLTLQIHFLISILSCILYSCIFFQPGGTSHGSPIRTDPLGQHYLYAIVNCLFVCFSCLLVCLFFFGIFVIYGN